MSSLQRYAQAIAAHRDHCTPDEDGLCVICREPVPEREED